ncbi:MAG: preprotein translocase subunit SecY [Pseudomonadota bacterium]
MVSAAEQLAANLNFSVFSKAEELKKRIWFTLGALIVYRVGTYIPLPGVDSIAFTQAFQSQAGGILGMFNMFAGGAVERMAIFALNIMPYISASIIIQLMTTVSPHLEQLKKEGETGRKKINQYTRYGTVFLAAIQAFGIASLLQSQNIVLPQYAGWFFTFTTVITLVGGTIFLMWLGEQITARGIGNGISLIIFAGIIAEFPASIASILDLGRTGALSTAVILGLFVMAIGVVAFIVFMERAQRRLLVQYPKRQVGNRVSQGDTSHLPLKLNTAGVIPPIFASSLLLLPVTFAAATQGGPQWLIDVTAMLGQGQPLFLVIYAALIIFFAFFYTAIVFNPKDTADNLKKYGGFIPGIRPGQRTAEHIDHVLSRITVVGAGYLALVCILPEMLRSELGVANALFGGTSLLIVVSVTMDTVAQVQSHLLAHQYEGLIKKSKLRGAKRR